jgi:pimeloyl-ACP methyl ester carboxylesterase
MNQDLGIPHHRRDTFPLGDSNGTLGRLHRAAKIRTPILWGARDPFIPVRHAFEAHEAIPGSRLEIFDDVGHYPHCEAPERFVSVLLEVIDSTEPARLSAVSARPTRSVRSRSWREPLP